MVDESYAQSKCPYHRVLYWLITRWVTLLAIVVIVAILLLVVYLG